jgi:tetratricopeptide (TPR) repeat protein
LAHNPSSRAKKPYQVLIAENALDIDCLMICSVPLFFSKDLLGIVVKKFAKKSDFKLFWITLNNFALLTQINEKLFRLNKDVRDHFLMRFEKEDITRAQKVHSSIISYLHKNEEIIHDRIQNQLQIAYHTAYINPDESASIYWTVYCQSRESNRYAMLSALSILSNDQKHLLKNYRNEVNLYQAASLFYQGGMEGLEKSDQKLESIIKSNPRLPVIIDACFLLANIRESSEQKEALRLYQRSIDSGKKYLEDQKLSPENHLRIIVARSYFNMASIFKLNGDYDQAEICYRYGIQVVSEEPGYQATKLRELVSVMQNAGKKNDQMEEVVERINQIEGPFLSKFRERAFLDSENIGYRYYAISALNHGLGYEGQHVRFEIEKDGSVHVEGLFSLFSTSTMSLIDTYLETTADSKTGLHFKTIESLTPPYSITPRSVTKENTLDGDRIEISIDPPLQPGGIMTYRWTGESGPGTISMSPEELKKRGLPYEYIFWDIIAPIEFLDIHVVLPLENQSLHHRTWFDLWRVGRWRATQTQTAYRTHIKNDPSSVVFRESRTSNKQEIFLKVHYPWLAMRYILAWKFYEMEDE